MAKTQRYDDRESGRTIDVAHTDRYWGVMCRTGECTFVATQLPDESAALRLGFSHPCPDSSVSQITPETEEALRAAFWDMWAEPDFGDTHEFKIQREEDDDLTFSNESLVTIFTMIRLFVGARLWGRISKSGKAVRWANITVTVDAREKAPDEKTD
jgi:hypothetical protein